MQTVRIHIFTLVIAIFFVVSCKRKEYTSGEAVFKGECIKCHKLNGTGGDKGPDLSTLFSKRTDDYVRTYILDPRSLKPDSVMPPAEISEKELDMVIRHLRENSSAHSSANLP